MASLSFPKLPKKSELLFLRVVAGAPAPALGLRLRPRLLDLSDQIPILAVAVAVAVFHASFLLVMGLLSHEHRRRQSGRRLLLPSQRLDRPQLLLL